MTAMLIALALIGLSALGASPALAQTPPPSQTPPPAQAPPPATTCTGTISWLSYADPGSGQRGVPLGNGVSIVLSDGRTFGNLSREGGKLEVPGLQPGVSYRYQVTYTGCPQEVPGSPWVCVGGVPYQPLGGHAGVVSCGPPRPPA
jgi:hypothetical protein